MNRSLLYIYCTSSPSTKPNNKLFQSIQRKLRHLASDEHPVFQCYTFIVKYKMILHIAIFASKPNECWFGDVSQMNSVTVATNMALLSTLTSYNPAWLVTLLACWKVRKKFGGACECVKISILWMCPWQINGLLKDNEKVQSSPTAAPIDNDSEIQKIKKVKPNTYILII